MGRRAPVLPYNRPANGSTRFAIPDDHRFSLVGDPDPGNIPRTDPRLLDGLFGNLELGFTDFLGVMFHPTGLWKVLPEFLLSHRDDPTLPIEEDGS